MSAGGKLALEKAAGAGAAMSAHAKRPAQVPQ